MISMLFTVALAATSPVQQPLDITKPALTFKILPSAPLGSFGKPLVDANGNLVTCKRSAIQTLGPNGAPAQKLGDLPPGLMEHAVNRLVNGCPVREIVSGGQTYYLDAPVGRLERLDPVVYAKPPIPER